MLSISLLGTLRRGTTPFHLPKINMDAHQYHPVKLNIALGGGLGTGSLERSHADLMAEFALLFLREGQETAGDLRVWPALQFWAHPIFFYFPPLPIAAISIDNL